MNSLKLDMKQSPDRIMGKIVKLVKKGDVPVEKHQKTADKIFVEIYRAMYNLNPKGKRIA